MNTTVPHRLPRRLAAAAASFCLLSLAACGGGGGSSPAASTPVPSQPAAPTPAPALMAPVIAVQPASVTVASGAPATFSVSAGTDTTLQYQWLRNGVALPQAVQSSLTVTASPADDGAVYRVVLKNAAGEARSERAALRLAGTAPYRVIGAVDTDYLYQQLYFPNGTALPPRESNGKGFVDGVASVARFDTISSIAADMAGNLYVADLWNNAVRKVSPSGVVSTLARGLNPVEGGGVLLKVSAGLDGSAYAIDNMGALSIDASGTVTRLVTPVYSNWMPGWTYSSQPLAIAADRQGNVYEVIYEHVQAGQCTGSGICSADSRVKLHKVGADGTTRDWSAIEGPAKPAGSAGLVPEAITIDAAGKLYLSDAASDAIWTLTPAGEWSLFSGTRQRSAQGLAVDSLGNLYALDIADKLASIRQITPGGKVTVLAGDASTPRLYGSSFGGYDIIPAIAIDAGNRLWVTQGEGVVQLDHP